MLGPPAGVARPGASRAQEIPPRDDRTYREEAEEVRIPLVDSYAQAGGGVDDALVPRRARPIHELSHDIAGCRDAAGPTPHLRSAEAGRPANSRSPLAHQRVPRDRPHLDLGAVGDPH